MEKTATSRQPAATLSPARLKQLENQLANAEIEKAEAQEFFNRARTYLMRCTRRVQDLKAEMHYGKEVRHA